EGRMVQRREILLHGAAGCRRIDLLLPLGAGDRPLTIGVGFDQARIDRKSFDADQPCPYAGLHDALEDATEEIALPKTLVAGTRERRMVRDAVLKPQIAKPSIGQVDLNLATELPLRSDREDIANDEHPDHQYRIDRRPAGLGVVRCERRIDP